MTDYIINSAGSSTTTFPENLEVGDKLIFNNTSTGRDGTILEWTVPEHMVVRITAYGAQGGNLTEGAWGGLGAKIQGEFELQQGNELEILVGQVGQSDYNNPDTSGSGGGGGTFITKKGVFNSGSGTKSDIYVIAGGGGGTHSSADTYGTPPNSNQHGSEFEDGQDAGCALGGTNGQAGNKCSSHQEGGQAPGAGFLENAPDGNWGEGGDAYINGGVGGATDSKEDANGGFGGGSGAHGNSAGCAGGGGYSGGAGGDPHLNEENAPGGGGGSYNDGTNQDNESGVNTGHGLVEIEILSMGSFTIKDKVTLNSTNVEGAKVRLINDTTNEYVGDTLTDVNGEYEFEVGSDTDDFHAMVEYESGGNKYHAYSKPFIKGGEDE